MVMSISFTRSQNCSYECARYYNIPLYTSLDEVEERVDVACVAVKTGALGGEGANIAKQLLRKGINVLLEQPVHYKELGECYKIAQNQKVYFGVGNLYLNLPAVQNFIRNVHIVSKTEKIAYINVDLATQVSYPVISILGEVLQTLRPWENVGSICGHVPFQTETVKIGDIPISFRAHNEIEKENIDGFLHIQYHELVDRITDEYVRKIEQLHYKNINLIGYCLGGILALNVAVKLLEKGIEVNNLFVIDSYPVSGKVEDQFIDEVIFLPNYQLMLSEVLEDVDDFKVMEFITEVRKRNNGNIPQNTFFNIIEKDTKMKNNSGLWEFVNSTKEKRFEAYAKAIEKKTCINVSAELLEATFEIYQHGFKGANVELPFYSGDICYLSACEEQKYFFADKNQNLEMWNDICLGEFEVINVPGNHVTCIHSEENATLLAQIIIERNIRG